MRTVSTSEIKVSQRIREVDREKIQELSESIKLLGLLQPVVINKDLKKVSLKNSLFIVFT